MPSPVPTTDTRELFGPLQSFPWVGAVHESYDPNIDAFWYANEETQSLSYIANCLDISKFEKFYLGGMRIVYHKQCVYCVMALDFRKKDPAENAFDRAMSIVGKR